jgi:DNA-binding transcriptional LysR family regulator
MDLRQLEYAVAVVDRGTFTAAAQALHVAQPSLSQGVARLERELGVALFHRVGRGVVLTAAGEAMLEPARQALRAAATARSAVAAVAGLTGGHLDIVCLPTLAVDPAASLIGAFRRRYPDITVRVAEPEDPETLAAFVRTGICEVGVTELPVAGRELLARPLAAQEYLVVLAPGTEPAAKTRRAVPIEQLAEWPLVTTPPGTSSRRQLDDAFALAGLQPDIAVETSHREMIVPLVLAGAGAALLPEPIALDAVVRGASTHPLEPPVVREIGIVYRPGPMSPAARAFLATAQS